MNFTPNTPAWDNKDTYNCPFERGQQAGTASVPTTSLDQGTSQVAPAKAVDVGPG